jgi:hypothetical protein
MMSGNGYEYAPTQDDINRMQVNKEIAAQKERVRYGKLANSDPYAKSLMDVVTVAGETASIPASIPGAIYEGDIKKALPTFMQDKLDPKGYGEHSQSTPANTFIPGYKQWAENHPILATGVDLATGAASTGLAKGAKKVSNLKKEVPIDDAKVFDFNEILDPKFDYDIHDVRHRYYSGQVYLSPNEQKLLKEKGLGNPENYKDISGKDILGSHYSKPSTKKEPKFNPNENIEELLYGKEFNDRLDENISDVKESTSDYSIEKSTDNLNAAENLNIESLKQDEKIISPFSKQDFTYKPYIPYERSAASRDADKWLEDWYDTKETKQKFSDYGGKKEDWDKVQNSLQNPIRSGYEKWNNMAPGGVYHPIFNQASIPSTSSSLDLSTVSAGVHEGAHKTGIGMRSKGTTSLPRLFNDLADSVRETPWESYAEIARMRYNMGWKPGQKISMDELEKGLNTIATTGYLLPMKIKDKNKFLDIVNKAPIITGAIGTAVYNQQNDNQYRNGGYTKPNPKSYHNDYPGIKSNESKQYKASNIKNLSEIKEKSSKNLPNLTKIASDAMVLRAYIKKKNIKEAIINDKIYQFNSNGTIKIK